MFCLQIKRDFSSYNTLWYMNGCSLVNNTVVQHALVASVGNRTTWRQYDTLLVRASTGGAMTGNQPAKVALEDMSVAFWLVGCKLEGNLLATPAWQQHPTTTAPPCGSWAHLVGGGRSSPDPASVAEDDAQLHLFLASAASLNSIAGLPCEDRAQVLRALIAASAKTRVASQPKGHGHYPAVLSSTCSEGLVAGTVFSRNEGFSHVVRMDQTKGTLSAVLMHNAHRLHTAFDAWYSDIHLENLGIHNTSANGSIVSAESVRGTLRQV
jgi:hypothetical protein